MRIDQNAYPFCNRLLVEPLNAGLGEIFLASVLVSYRKLLGLKKKRYYLFIFREKERSGEMERNIDLREKH